MVVSIINQGLCAMTSITNFVGNETFFTVYNIVSIAITGLASALGFWYNNSFTEEAKQGDMVMYELKEYNKTIKEDKETVEESEEYADEDGE